MNCNHEGVVVTTHTAKLEKLVRIRLEYFHHTITSIGITGDFFMHPEDTIDLLETKLRGAALDMDTLRRIIASALAGTQCFGFDAESLAGAIMDAQTIPGGGAP